MSYAQTAPPELDQTRATRRLSSTQNLWALHRTSLLVGGALLLAVGTAHVLNMQGWPGRVNDDEGTYVAQAWAIIHDGSLAHYTYAYDHPPLGWLVIAFYAWLTDGFGRTASALMVGRELMLIANLISSGLIYMLARRVGLRRVFAAVTVVLFAFSPIALQYHRMVFLDNLAVTWALAALVFAGSPRRSLAAALGCGVTFGCAVLTKETVALLLPVVIWVLVQNTDKRTRAWNLSVAGSTMFAVGFFYPLYSILKKEFLEGPGHVSLLGAVRWQLFERPGSGSVLDRMSDSANLVRSWLELDPWLLLASTALIPVALCVQKLRPMSLAMVLQLAVMFRGGYLPFPYVISMLPFAALLIGGVADSAWSFVTAARRDSARFTGLRLAAGPLVMVCAGFLVYSATPGWARVMEVSVTTDLSGPPEQATAWIKENVAKDAVIVVDDYVWPDLALSGFEKQIWHYKVDLDPEVQAKQLPNGWASIDYVALDKFADSTLKVLPTVVEAINHSEVVATFGEGEIVVRKVIKPTG